MKGFKNVIMISAVLIFAGVASADVTVNPMTQPTSEALEQTSTDAYSSIKRAAKGKMPAVGLLGYIPITKIKEASGWDCGTGGDFYLQSFLESTKGKKIAGFIALENGDLKLKGKGNTKKFSAKGTSRKTGLKRKITVKGKFTNTGIKVTYSEKAIHSGKAVCTWVRKGLFAY